MGDSGGDFAAANVGGDVLVIAGGRADAALTNNCGTTGRVAEAAEAAEPAPPGTGEADAEVDVGGSLPALESERDNSS